MNVRFVYPTIDPVFDIPSLLIYKEDEYEDDDDYIWLKIDEGINNYCQENNLNIADIIWKVDVNGKDYVDITAKSVDDWVKQFTSLKITSWQKR